jgi:hypothetical protein
MPTPIVAPPRASRIALDFTARQARQANARSASCSEDAGSPQARVQDAGSSPGASIASRCWRSSPPEIARCSAGAGAQVAVSTRMFFLRARISTAPSA